MGCRCSFQVRFVKRFSTRRELQLESFLTSSCSTHSRVRFLFETHNSVILEAKQNMAHSVHEIAQRLCPMHDILECIPQRLLHELIVQDVFGPFTKSFKFFFIANPQRARNKTNNTLKQFETASKFQNSKPMGYVCIQQIGTSHRAIDRRNLSNIHKLLDFCSCGAHGVRNESSL